MGQGSRGLADLALVPTLPLFFQTVEQLLTSGQPLLIFLEEAPGYPGPRLSALGQAWLGLVVQAVQAGIVPDATLVPVATAYDLVPDAPCNMTHVRSGSKWTSVLGGTVCSVDGLL